MDDYFVECEEHLATIRRLLLTLEAGVGRQAAPPAVLDELFRSFHSIKGISGMVELRDAEMLAHHMESYLRALRQREAQLTAAGMDALIRGVDALEQTIAARREQAAAPSIDLMVRQLAAVLPQAGARRRAAAGRAAAPWPRRRGACTFVPSPTLLARGVNVDSVRARLRDAGTIVDATPKVTSEGIAFEFLLAGELDEASLAEWEADGHARRAGDRGRSRPPAGERGARQRRARRLDACRPRRSRAARRTHADDRRPGDQPGAARRRAGARRRPRCRPPIWRAIQENTQTHRASAARSPRRGDAAPPGAGRRDLPADAVRGARPGAGDRHAGAARAARPGNRDRQVPDRADDGSGPAPGARTPSATASSRRRRAWPRASPRKGRSRSPRASVGEAVVLEIADDGRGIDAEAVAARARALGFPLPDGPIDAATLLDVLVRAGLLHARRDRSRQRPRRRHGGRQDDRRRAERHDDAADRARRGHAVRRSSCRSPCRSPTR